MNAVLITIITLLIIAVTVETHPVHNGPKLQRENELNLIDTNTLAEPSLVRFHKENQKKQKEKFFLEGITPLAYRPLDLGEIKPTGWLFEIIRTQAAGLSGHLGTFLKIFRFNDDYYNFK
jgi:hypothetical protein